MSMENLTEKLVQAVKAAKINPSDRSTLITISENDLVSILSKWNEYKWFYTKAILPREDFIGIGNEGYMLFKQSETFHTPESFCNQFGITIWQPLPTPPTT